MPEYWYDPDEIKYQADHAKVQPEFDPLLSEDNPLNDDEAIRIIDDVSYEGADPDKVAIVKTRADEIRAIISGFNQEHDPLA